MGCKIVTKGNFKRSKKFLKDQLKHRYLSKLEKYGQLGLDALIAATPVRTGKTAASWRYRIINNQDEVTLVWENTNENQNGDNIVKLLVRGHGTKNGSYVKGNNFVTPIINEVFDMIAKEVLKEVK